ncbi:MAG: Fe-S cluster assembly protein SufD, partial [Candidatus Baumannia cicadellinicola]|nr:Fe-S cluster assembly protein SufD [Candidatus Baumannia cicadellinicola]
LLENHIQHDIHASTHWQKVMQLGLSTSNNEHWKKKQRDILLSYDLIHLPISHVSYSEHDNVSFAIDACRLVFVNGYFAPNLSNSNIYPWQVQVEQGANRQRLPEPICSEVFLHLTECLSRETTRIRLPTGKIAPKPLYLLHISQASSDKNMLNMLHYRHHIEIEPHAMGQVIEHFVNLTTTDLAHFSGARITMDVRNNAHLSHIKLAGEKNNSYHFAHNDITIGLNAVVRDYSFIFSPGMTQHQTSMQLNGEGSDVLVKSLLLLTHQDISDICTYLEHNKGYCCSHQLHKLIALDQGQGMFNGLIKVNQEALKTNGKMINNNLLLGKLANIHSKPQLEIYTDDVKCSHGTTVSSFDHNQMFYLRSRGINKNDAQHTMISAFAADIIDTIGNEFLQKLIYTAIIDTLQQNIVAL